VADATYFGLRREDTSWCVVVLRDPRIRENLWWKFCETETTSVYREGRDYLKQLGYVIKSVTGDGFNGIRSAFLSIPYQMCQVHMERLVISGTTRKPQTEAGQVLLALTRTLPQTDSVIFNDRLIQFINKYRDFLNEKTTHHLSGEVSFTHAGVRYAYRSLVRLADHLFTYEKDKHIAKTTNSLEGYFSHLNEKIANHRGLTRFQKERVLNSTLLASTTAPSTAKLKLCYETLFQVRFFVPYA